MACNDQPLCHVAQPSPSSVLFADGRSPIGGDGCYDAVFLQSPGLCLPSIWPQSAGVVQGPPLQDLEVTLVALFWPLKPWFPDLLESLVEVPFLFPMQKDLLKHPNFNHYLLDLRKNQLTGFRISSKPQGISDSLREWLISLPSAATLQRE